MVHKRNNGRRTHAIGLYLRAIIWVRLLNRKRGAALLLRRDLQRSPDRSRIYDSFPSVGKHRHSNLTCGSPEMPRSIINLERLPTHYAWYFVRVKESQRKMVEMQLHVLVFMAKCSAIAYSSERSFCGICKQDLMVN